jgi:hypothetical protein
MNPLSSDLIRIVLLLSEDVRAPFLYQRVCKAWKEATNDETLWKLWFAAHFSIENKHGENYLVVFTHLGNESWKDYAQKIAIIFSNLTFK